MTPAITLARAIADVKLLGGPFEAESFWTWRVVAKLLCGEPLTEPREIELFKQCTGRSTLPNGPVRRLVILVGRRGGKDRFLSAVAVWRAALCAKWRKYISAGEQAVVILLGADKKQAAILRRYCHGLLAVPMLAREVVRQTDELIEFKNGASLEIATNDARLVRGRSAIAVLGSEASYWKTDEHSASSDEEVVSAAEPSMAMCPDGGLLLLGSSVYRKRGYMYRMYRKLHGNDAAEDLCWFAPSGVMNPKLPARVVDKALADDPSKAGAEYLGRWREDVADFCPLDVIEGATEFGVKQVPPQRGVQYFAFVDAASGTGKDSFALAIAHRERGAAEMVRLDLLLERKPRFVPADVVRQYAEILRHYNIRQVEGDKYAGGFHADEWSRHRITFTPCERTTSDNYLHALPMLLNGRARLIDSPALRAQLASLERRVTGGREHVAHPNVASAHDDLATATAGALVAAGYKVGSYNLDYSWVDGVSGDAGFFAALYEARRLARLGRVGAWW